MKKLICLLLVAVLLFVPATAFALTDSDSIAEQMAGDPLDVQLQKILNSPYTTPYQKELALEKYNFLTGYNEQKISKDTRIEYYCFIPVSRQAQELPNWCGPATIYQTLKYINGSSPSQQQIANDVMPGSNVTTISNLIRYLNENQSRNSYMSTTILNTQTDFFSYLVKLTILNNNSPVIVLFIPNQIPILQTSTSGMHFANVRGQSSDGSAVFMVDPGYTVGGSGYYTVTRAALLNAIYACPSGCNVVIY